MHLFNLCLLGAIIPAAYAAIDCKGLKVADNSYDLSDLSEAFLVTREEKNPPTKNKIETIFSLCKPIDQKRDAPAEDQCDSSSFICEITTNIKDSAKVEKERVIYTKSWSNGKYDASVTDDGIFLDYSGSKYKDKDLFDIKKGEPKIDAFNTTNLDVSWKTAAACSTKDLPVAGKGMSGWGIFFLLLFIAFIAYFILGSAYKYDPHYTVLRIHHFPDFIPNHRFWENAFKTVTDFFSNLFRRSGGYPIMEWSSQDEDILNKIAADNEMTKPWPEVVPLIQYKLQQVLEKDAAESLIGVLATFSESPPFTIQRLCELLQRPTEHHTTNEKLRRAIEKVLSITSFQPSPHITMTDEDHPMEGA
ncbi:hypothetical protein HDU97_003269 [Phlyctochytrium planicorne]|nr:hypothetical protein HDU97_003269 [Phlyctochytrium planicorne]